MRSQFQGENMKAQDRANANILDTRCAKN